MIQNYWEHDLFKEIQPHITGKFRIFHEKNPHIFDLFQKYASEAFFSGRKHFGVRMITERVRWHVAVETKGNMFKLNNNYNSCYARLLMIQQPAYRKMFSRRSSTSGNSDDCEAA